LPATRRGERKARFQLPRPGPSRRSLRAAAAHSHRHRRWPLTEAAGARAFTGAGNLCQAGLLAGWPADRAVPAAKPRRRPRRPGPSPCPASDCVRRSAWSPTQGGPRCKSPGPATRPGKPGQPQQQGRRPLLMALHGQMIGEYVKGRPGFQLPSSLAPPSAGRELEAGPDSPAARRRKASAARRMVSAPHWARAHLLNQPFADARFPAAGHKRSSTVRAASGARQLEIRALALVITTMEWFGAGPQAQ